MKGHFSVFEKSGQSPAEVCRCRATIKRILYTAINLLTLAGKRPLLWFFHCFAGKLLNIFYFLATDTATKTVCLCANPAVQTLPWALRAECNALLIWAMLSSDEKSIILFHLIWIKRAGSFMYLPEANGQHSLIKLQLRMVMGMPNWLIRAEQVN